MDNFNDNVNIVDEAEATETLENQQIKESIQQVAPPKAKKLTVLKIISIILVAIYAGFMIWNFLDGVVIPHVRQEENYQLGLAFFLMFIVIIFGLIGMVIAMIPGLIGMILSLVKKNNCTTGTKILFIILTVLPVLIEAIIYVVTVMIAQG